MGRNSTQVAEGNQESAGETAQNITNVCCQNKQGTVLILGVYDDSVAAVKKQELQWECF